MFNHPWYFVLSLQALMSLASSTWPKPSQRTSYCELNGNKAPPAWHRVPVPNSSKQKLKQKINDDWSALLQQQSYRKCRTLKRSGALSIYLPLLYHNIPTVILRTVGLVHMYERRV